jgi:4-diphosphocytidyl-2-C-methyl-D-erythritol kinase
MPNASVRCGSQGDGVSLLREGLLFNRFEDVVYSLFPRLKDLSLRLQAEGFPKVLLSGSGSTIFGVCDDGAQASRLEARLSAELDADVFAVESLPAWRSASC